MAFIQNNDSRGVGTEHGRESLPNAACALDGKLEKLECAIGVRSQLKQLAKENPITNNAAVYTADRSAKKADSRNGANETSIAVAKKNPNNISYAGNLATQRGQTGFESTDLERNEKTFTSGYKISQYFDRNKREILKKIAASNDSKTAKENANKAVEIIATNNETHTVNITDTNIGHDVSGEFDALKNTIYISKNFNAGDPLSQATLIHEVVHKLQDINTQTRAKSDSSLDQRRRDFLTTDSAIAVPEWEQSSIEAELAYVNSLSNGSLKKAVLENADFDEYMTKAKSILLSLGSSQGTRLDTVASRAFYYYGKPNEWPYFVRHLYGCRLGGGTGAVLFTPSLSKIGKPKADECEKLKTRGGM